MGFPQAPDTPVCEDDTACIECGNLVISGGRKRAKHIDLRKHFALETIQNRMMGLIEIDTSKQLADIFTKPLANGCIRGILGRPDIILCREDSPVALCTTGVQTLSTGGLPRKGVWVSHSGPPGGDIMCVGCRKRITPAATA
jgi:hypothetical protein